VHKSKCKLSARRDAGDAILHSSLCILHFDFPPVRAAVLH